MTDMDDDPMDGIMDATSNEDIDDQVAEHAMMLGELILQYGRTHRLHPGALMQILAATMAAVLVPNLRPREDAFEKAVAVMHADLDFKMRHAYSELACGGPVQGSA